MARRNASAPAATVTPAANGAVAAVAPVDNSGGSLADLTEKIMQHKAQIAAWFLVVLCAAGLGVGVAYYAANAILIGVVAAVLSGGVIFTGKIFVTWLSQMLIWGTKIQVIGRAAVSIFAAIILMGTTGYVWQWGVSVFLLWLVVDRLCGYIGTVELYEIEEEIKQASTN